LKLNNFDKLQITSTKLQINLKSQYPLNKTCFHLEGVRGGFDLGFTVAQIINLKLQY